METIVKVRKFMRNPQELNHKTIVISGPTASGKSSFALALAKKIDGTIVNADSMQLYRDLPILTAQPSENDKRSVSHDLYGILRPHEMYSAVKWAQLLPQVPIHKPVILVGGTGLYLETLTKGISKLPNISTEIREEGQNLLRKKGLDYLYQEVCAQDPDHIGILHPSDTQRVLRAWEMLCETKKSIMEWQQDNPPQPILTDFFAINFMPDRQILHENIERRVQAMIDQGALAEVAHFLVEYPQALEENWPILRVLGLQEMMQYLLKNIRFEAACAALLVKTRQYAKRQSTWFRHRKPVAAQEKYNATFLSNLDFVPESLYRNISLFLENFENASET